MKIKTSLLYSIAAGTLLSATVANGQGSATDPVGFTTIKIYGSNENGPRFSLVCPTLVNPIEFASATVSITPTTITVDGTPFDGLDFGTNPGGANEPAFNAFYVEVTSGPEAGAWGNITANDGNTLTIDRDLSAAGAEKIAIRKHVTVEEMFGESGLGAGGQVSDADEISLFAGGSSDVMYIDNTPGFEGISDATFAVRNNTPIEPQQAVYILRKSPEDVCYTRAGHVKVGQTKLQILAGFNAVANPRAVGIDDDDNPVFTLGLSNLFDENDLANSIDPGDNPNDADEILVPNPDGTFSVYFRDDTVGFEGYVDAGLNPRDDIPLVATVGFILNRKTTLTGTPFVWCVPAQPIAEN